MFRDLTKLEKRALASKYLHFHRPSLFFIYDERAAEAVRLLRLPRVPRQAEEQNADAVYGVFFEKCLSLCDTICTEHAVSLTPRELDNLLLEISRLGQF